MAYDGLVSRYLNRPLSRPAARALQGTGATPNALTAGTFLLAIIAGVMVALGWNIAGGILIQGASVADGIDGELARLKGMATHFGEVFDAITDRYADAIMLGGMAIFAVRFEELPRAEVIGLLAIAGSLTVSYSRARIEASLADGVGGSMDSVFGLASRDVRSLVAAAGAVLGQCYWALVIIAVACALTVVWRLIFLRIKGIGTAPS